jgi:DNA polymerase III delta prime subunit
MNDLFDFRNNIVILGDRGVLYVEVKEKACQFFASEDIFEIEKLNISVDDIRRMISFVGKGSESTKLIFLSSFYWADEAQNAMLKVLEETPHNTVIYLFGLNQKTFLPTVLSRVQKVSFHKVNRFLPIAKKTLEMERSERLESKDVKKILSLKAVDYNFEKNTEVEKKDREAHVLFLFALMDLLLENKDKLNKVFLGQILKISELAEIEGGSPHLFIEWLLLSAPKLG